MNQNQAAELIATLESRARRFETVCGSGKMVWRCWGQGRPVVLLHGGAGGWMHWIKNIEPLARHHAVWVPDMPGFGESDLPTEDPLDADTLAPYVTQGIQTLLADEHFDLVGFSFGTLVAAAIAADAPPTLDRLILVSASGLGLFQGSPSMKSMRGLTDPAERAEVLRFNLNAMMLHDRANIDDLAILIQKTSAVRDRVKNRKIARTDFIVQTSPRWKVPVFGIWGRNDFAYRDQFPNLVKVAAGLNLHEIVFMDDGGHWLQFECPQAFDEVLARILHAPVASVAG